MILVNTCKYMNIYRNVQYRSIHNFSFTQPSARETKQICPHKEGTAPPHPS